MKNKHTLIEITTVLGVMLAALALRLFRINELAIFLSDQAIDSFAVKQILAGNLTLLGPRASVGQFFNGPIVYYLMAPFYLVFHNDPLAGTFFQITLQIATIPFLYLLTKRFGGVKSGVISIFIFTFSLLLISYSRATFNAYPAIFFTTVIIYLISKKNVSNVLLLIGGILTGMLVQMHYFLFLFAFFSFVYIFLKERSFGKIAIFLLGGLIGLSPFLAFELRHAFLNTRAIFGVGGTLSESASIIEKVGAVGTTLSQLIGISSTVFGLVSLVIVSYLVFRDQLGHKLKQLYVPILCVLLVTTVFYPGSLQAHYIIGFFPVFIVGLSCAIAKYVSHRILIPMALVYVSCFFVFHANLFSISPDQDGFGLRDQRRAVSIISTWQKKNELTHPWNITQDAQRDNRAMPLRYLLSLNTDISQPLPIEDYLSNTELVVLVPQPKSVNQIRTWEVQSFGEDYEVVEHALISEKYGVFLLRKINLPRSGADDVQ